MTFCIASSIPSPTPRFPSRKPVAPRPLKGVRILSLALNLPGPAALMRCRYMGATCLKLEPPAPKGMPPSAPGDPMGLYNPSAYAQMHEGVKVMRADLKTEAGQAALHKALAKTDVLITSFRPSALVKLQLTWRGLHKRYPALSQIAIVGAAGARAEEPGHDLTYMADNHLVPALDLPPSLYADMGGSLMAIEAILQALLTQKSTGRGVFLEVALASAAGYLALPRTWGLTRPPGTLGVNDIGGAVGGAHAGYKVYACQDGRVAVAALEPHFAAALCLAAGVTGGNMLTMFAPQTHQAIAAFLKSQTQAQLDALAVSRDIPLHTMD